MLQKSSIQDFMGSNSFMENLTFLDFPMESVEGGFEEEIEAEDWNVKLQSAFGPIPFEFLSRCLNENVANGASDLMLNGSETVADERLPPHLSKDTSNRNKSEPSQPLSPISVLDDRSSRIATQIPRRVRSKRSRPLRNKTWTFTMPEKHIIKKKKIPERKTCLGAQSKRCSHCQVTQTPQWREGPMGPKTLCNACGVRHRSGRLYPEYRPVASPGFIPSLHSNSHKKVLEMRNMKFDNSAGVNVTVVPGRRGKTTPRNERENSPSPEFIPMSDYLRDCVLGSEVLKY